MSKCKVNECNCGYNLTRKKILEKLDELTDSLVLLAGLRVSQDIKMRFTERLGRVFRITVFFGEDHPFEESMEVTIHSECDLDKFYTYGMLLSRFYRVQKFGEIPNTSTSFVSRETGENTCNEDEMNDTVSFDIYIPK